MRQAAGVELGRLQAGLGELGVDLSSEQWEMFNAYRESLLRWNRRINLTAIEDAEGGEVAHFLDSAPVLPLMPRPFPSGYTVLDVGTGAGFPGLPLRILQSGIRLTVLESVGKKVRFLQELLYHLGRDGMGLTDVTVIHDRAEAAAHAPAWREQFDLVVARALAPLPVLAELCLPFCRQGGQVVAYKRGDISREVAAAGPALETLGGRLERVVPVEVSAFHDGRVLVVVEKVAATPSAYPRRPGIPAKRPLRARAGSGR